MKKIIEKYRFVFVVFSFIFFDQILKYLIRYFDGFYVCNKGISFGFLMPGYIFYSVVTVIILSLFCYLFDKIKFNKFILSKIGISFVLGGAIANLIDRYRYGCVLDFIDFKFFPVFNFADIFITVGATIIMMKIYRK